MSEHVDIERLNRHLSELAWAPTAEISRDELIAVLSRLEQAEQDRDKLRNRLDAMRRQRDGYRNQLRKARTNQGENQ